MTTTKSDKQIAFSITVDQIQEEAKKRFGRALDESELDAAVKGVEAGLSFDMDTVLETAIKEAVSE